MNKNQKIISWLGTVLSLAGAFLVANMFFIHGYTLFAIGAMIWVYIARIQENSALVFLEICFLMANINGLVTYWSL